MSARHLPGGGYERRDADARASFRAGVYLLGAMFLTALLVVPFYRLLAERESALQPEPMPAVKSETSEPFATFPRLVESEPRVLAEFRAQEDALLESYGWVEKDKGIVRIPIDEAMRIVAERGLPQFPASAAGAGK